VLSRPPAGGRRTWRKDNDGSAFTDAASNAGLSAGALFPCPDAVLHPNRAVAQSASAALYPGIFALPGYRPYIGKVTTGRYGHLNLTSGGRFQSKVEGREGRF
jgi:hypothetical protein